MERKKQMFNVYDIKDGEHIINRETFLEIARILCDRESADEVKKAEDTYGEMLSEMLHTFSTGAVVKYLNGEGQFTNFKSINQFKCWLIVNQHMPSFKSLFDYFKLYCENNNILLPRLNIAFGDYYESIIYNTEVYFRNTFRPEWLEEEQIKKAIRDVDKSIVINGNAIESPVFGIMPPTKLSGGVKTLMLMYNNPHMVFNASTCGDNCVPFIEEMIKEKDILIGLYHAMDFSKKDFEAYIVNGDVVINSYEEYIELADKYCRG